jgi:hypothetical protein
MAGITMIVEGKPGTVVFTDAEAAEIDESQYNSQSGPCLDADRRPRRGSRRTQPVRPATLGFP